ncbi:MAG: alpha-L-fucosidase [Pirellulaceae bacterium]|nr:alpha-L-fucosidase [Pirellulaceae bacterium]
MTLTLILLLFGCSASMAEESFLKESQAERDARMEWFRDAKFGLFIHWGLYSVPAGEWKDKNSYAEWISEQARIPMSEYEKYRDQFNPEKFDAAEWVALAKQAGMKYIVITSKHHEGFAMFHTKQTDWGIMSTPFKRDPLKELSEECKKAGLKFCVYYSILDWHHPDYDPRRPWNDTAAGEPNMESYIAFMKRQLKELVDNYGPLGILWFDGEWEKTWTHELGKDLYNYVRGLQPDIIINNRIGKNRRGMKGISVGEEIIGDFGTPEQQIPADGLPPGTDWESCMTMNDHWGYNKIDRNWKSSAKMIRMLIDVASKGGNLLLNVGPTAEGVIPEPSVERLREIGRWMKVNGESIHGASACPFPKAPQWGRITSKPGKLYLHVFDWPADGRLLVQTPKGKPAAAYLLADANREPLGIASGEGGVVISLPAQAPDAAASVVVLECHLPAGVQAKSKRTAASPATVTLALRK